jgi:hypothetical protein
MNRRAVITVSIICVMLMGTLLISSAPLKAQPQVSLREVAHIDKFGGNLMVQLNITISGITGVGDIPSQLRLIYPYGVGSRISYFRAGWMDNELNVDMLPDEDLYIITINLDKVSEVSDGNVTIETKLFIPFLVEATDPYKFSINFPAYPMMDLGLNYAYIEIDLPMGVDAVTYPVGFSKERIGPAGIDQYALKRTYYRDEIEALNESPTISIDIEARDGIGIYLFTSTISREVHLQPDGSYEVNDLIVFTSHLKHIIERTKSLRLSKTPSISDLRFFSSVGVPLQSNVRDYYAEIMLPFDLRSNSSLSIMARYRVTEEEINTTSIFPLGFHLYMKDFLSMNYLVEKMDMKVYAPSGELVYQDELYDVTPYTDVNIEVEFTASIVSVLSGVVGILYIPLIAGIGISIYRLLLSPFVFRRTRELIEFSSAFNEEIRIIRELIDLEDEYLDRKMKSKTYLDRRSKLIKRLRDVQIKVTNLEQKLKHMSQEKDIRVFTDIRGRLEEEWNQLKKLEKRFMDRKISPSDYVEERRQRLISFKATIRRAEAIVK